MTPSGQHLPSAETVHNYIDDIMQAACVYYIGLELLMCSFQSSFEQCGADREKQSPSVNEFYSISN